MTKERAKRPLIADIPFPLQDVMRMYWWTEEATREQESLPEAELVQEFIRWCKVPGNVKNLNEEEIAFLEENLASTMYSSQT